MVISVSARPSYCESKEENNVIYPLISDRFSIFSLNVIIIFLSFVTMKVPNTVPSAAFNSFDSGFGNTSNTSGMEIS